MLLTLYICLGYLFAPIAFGVVLWRGIAERGYWRGLGERFGFGPRLGDRALWVHAVSVGEVQAAAALVRTLRARFPGLPLVLTTSTPTGRARALQLFPQGIDVRFLPYDLPDAVARFADRIRPRLAVILETELWPNLYRACRRRGVPIVLASARLSARSVRRYRWLGPLVREMLSDNVRIAAQSATDAERFVSLGASPARVRVLGDIKFEFEPPADIGSRAAALRALSGASRPVWVAGSTHDGEEALVLDAHARLANACPGALLVLVPRHPPRCEAVAALLRRRGIGFASRSAGGAIGSDTGVLLVDTLGELVAWYAAADVAFVGGSLVPVGGHNLLEPAALGKAILCGPYTFNAPAIAAVLVAAGALEVVADAATLAAAVERLLADAAARERAGSFGHAAVAANRGALARLTALIEPLVGAAPAG